MYSFRDLHYMTILPMILLMACSQKEFGSDTARNSASSDVVIQEKPSDEEDVNQVQIDGRDIEEVLCQEGPRMIGLVSEVSFSEQFSLICDADTTNEFFKGLIRDVYLGEGTPKITVARSSTDSNYVTNFAYGYAIRVPLENPSMFADLEAHAIFAEGIAKENSELVIQVASRQPFPGRRSIEKVVLDYDLNNARGAAIHDIRKTEFNTYLLIEGNRDITVSTENLIDINNEYYHLANGLTIGIKAENNQSYLVFVTELVIKNRIDPERLAKTLLTLNEQVATMLHTYITEKSN